MNRAELHNTITGLFRFSPFIENSCRQDPELLDRLTASDRLQQSTSEQSYRQFLSRKLKRVTNDQQLMSTLRQFRREEMVRIAVRDLAGWGDYHTTVSELSALADVCLSETLDLLYRWQCDEEGTPKGEESGKPQQMLVIAMGKLGARELNFSSDIDLIFAYPEEGETRGRRPWISNQEFFTNLSRRLIKAINSNTADGFVFRVDMRLRPFGEAGAMASSFDAMEDYYQIHGRSWERYAWIKGRVVAGDMAAGESLMAMLRPFIYRRYFDYSAFESLREMKQMIARQVRKKGMLDDVKLGPGGIREIEFIGQAFQLVRGGAEKELQVRPILEVLPLLRDRGELSEADYQILVDAYLFLRNSEHRIQEYEDRQTQRLPQSDEQRQLLAESMQFENWEAYYTQLTQHRELVQLQFEQLFSDGESESESTQEEDPFPLIWGQISDGDHAETLQQWFEDGELIEHRLQQLAESSSMQSMSREGQDRLNRLMPLLIETASRQPHADESLMWAIRLVEGIGRRSVYFSMLAENSASLEHLLTLLQKSSWIAEQLAQHPMMLEELMDVRNITMPSGPEPLLKELQLLASRVEEGDLEQQMELMRHFQRRNILKIAAVDVMDKLPVMKVSDALTWISESLLTRSFQLCWSEMTRRMGQPRKRSEAEENPGFVAIGYGKMGGLELGYGSDLDMVFLHDGDPEAPFSRKQYPVSRREFYVRLGQRMIHLMTTRTMSGRLYEIDSRLRPNGNSGILVSDLEGFRDYQLNEAWTWEHQALIRARAVFGGGAAIKQFEAVRHEVLSQPRDPEKLRIDVVEMREKMRESLGRCKEGELHLKQMEGGMVDVEFIVQYLILRWAHDHPELLRWSDNVRQIESLAKEKLLSRDDAAKLVQNYRLFRRRAYHLFLENHAARVPDTEFAEECQQVIEVWQRVMA